MQLRILQIPGESRVVSVHTRASATGGRPGRTGEVCEEFS